MNEMEKSVAVDDNCDGLADGPFQESVTQDVGECVVYEICVTNTGDQDISDIEITDPLLGTFTIPGPLAPGQTECLNVPVPVPAPEAGAP